MANIVPKSHKKGNAKVREVLATYEKNRDLIAIGAYKRDEGQDEKLNFAIDKIEEVENYLKQRTEENPDYMESVNQMRALFEIERDSDDPKEYPE
jgi:flagellar biosynthesis/type III secretory pathway ATPase